VTTTFEGVAQDRLKKFAADALDIDVHLHSSDTKTGTSRFEVHVAVVILGTLAVGEDGVWIAFLHKGARLVMPGLTMWCQSPGLSDLRARLSPGAERECLGSLVTWYLFGGGAVPGCQIP
jgi:hypothetical protein